MTTTAPDRPLLSVREVGSTLGVSPSTVRRLIRSGALPAVRVGGSVRIVPQELNTFLFRERDSKRLEDSEAAACDRGAND